MDEAGAFRTTATVVGIGVGILGLAITRLGLVAGRRARAFEKAGARGAGVIDDYRLVDSSEGLYAPIIVFQTEAGHEHRFQSAMATSHRQVGKRVSVAYDPMRPERAEVVGAQPLSAAVLAGPALAAVGALLVLLGQLVE